jgi:sentrin-specific protease 1
MDKIYFPINIGNYHWTLAVAFVQERRIQYYDSMGGLGSTYLEELRKYFNDEHWHKKKTKDKREWTLVLCTAETPQQVGVKDCGVFVCMFAEFLSRGRPFTFSHKVINHCCYCIGKGILTQTISG